MAKVNNVTSVVPGTNLIVINPMSATSSQLQALEQTILTLPDADKRSLLNLLLDQLQTLPAAIVSRVEDLEDARLYQAMAMTQNEIPLSREAAIAQLDRP